MTAQIIPLRKVAKPRARRRPYQKTAAPRAGRQFHFHSAPPAATELFAVIDERVGHRRARNPPRRGQKIQGRLFLGCRDLAAQLATGLQRLGVRLEVAEAVLSHINGAAGGRTSLR
jgi:hypothetical protein